jgi:hypothetical protein
VYILGSNIYNGRENWRPPTIVSRRGPVLPDKALISRTSAATNVFELKTEATWQSYAFFSEANV